MQLVLRVLLPIGHEQHAKAGYEVPESLVAASVLLGKLAYALNWI